MNQTAKDPAKLYLRLGSHAEKEYFLKAIKLFDGIVVGANLLEATPGATASLLLNLKKMGKEILIDPITYSFGIGIKYLKAEKVRKKTGKTVQLKPSFVKLAAKYGHPFDTVLQQDRSIVPEDFIGNALPATVKAIGDYQINRLRNEFAADEELKEFAKDAPEPAAIFAPYFFCSSENADSISDLNLLLIESAVQQFGAAKVHAVLCMDRKLLGNATFLVSFQNKVKELKIPAIWLWVSDFDETQASAQELHQFRSFVESFAKTCRIYNLHGGYFSLCLNKFGMAGISHGVGYGESKDVVPVLSAGSPAVRYHLPPIHKRCGVPEIERSFESLGISTVENFADKICDCVVCKGVLADNIDNFGQFGEFFPSKSGSGRPAQTPASAKRCRYHFLFARRKEIEFVSREQISKIINDLKTSNDSYLNVESIPGTHKAHLAKWIAALS